jgi:hypothetical protein
LIENLVIPEGVTAVGCAMIAGSYIKSISFPSTLTTFNVTTNAMSCSALKVLDFSGTSMTSAAWATPKQLGAVEIIKFPDSLQTIGTSSAKVQLARNNANLAYVEFGTTSASSISSVYLSNYSGHAYSLIFHATTPPTFSFDASGVNPTAIYVPDAAVAAYQAASGFSSYSAKIKGLSELPSGWDTPSAS